MLIIILVALRKSELERVHAVSMRERGAPTLSIQFALPHESDDSGNVEDSTIHTVLESRGQESRQVESAIKVSDIMSDDGIQ